MDIDKYKSQSKPWAQYQKQLGRLRQQNIETGCIEDTVQNTAAYLQENGKTSLIIYGEPQSGKTEMMICLTAKLLDDGNPIIIHLMNDSVDLLQQNLKRFKKSGIAPAPQEVSELLMASNSTIRESVVFCKKNAHDLQKLTERFNNISKKIIIDDEADFATPNSKINLGEKTKINKLVENLIGDSGHYIGVTATPARLDVNNTFNNNTEKWVNFNPHRNYTGADIFFPVTIKDLKYRLVLLDRADASNDIEDALLRFLITSAFLNTHVNKSEKDYSFLVHTSGKKNDHQIDRLAIESLINSLRNTSDKSFDDLFYRILNFIKNLYPNADLDKIINYILQNSSRASLVVLNSGQERRDFDATTPSTPFTIIIGGNIVSRGVTFPNLLAMFFTRTVAGKLQQDTYIQRARMFGARGEYLEHFELTIPRGLYADWHKSFIFHRLALKTINDQLSAPVWMSDGRVSIVSSASVDKATVSQEKGEMAFHIFGYTPSLDEIVRLDPESIQTLRALRERIGERALPNFLINYIETNGKEFLAIHTASSIKGYKDAQQNEITRDKGFIGKTQLELNRFPNAVHHIKIFFNAAGQSRVFYKYLSGSINFMRNLKRYS